VRVHRMGWRMCEKECARLGNLCYVVNQLKHVSLSAILVSHGDTPRELSLTIDTQYAVRADGCRSARQRTYVRTKEHIRFLPLLSLF
jgi:hypothetical protein